MAKDIRKTARAIGLVAASNDTSFGQLVKIAKLNPAIDFRGADLAGVDFGALDISTFDLSSADLRKANLSRTQGFDPRNFVGADLSGAKLPPSTEELAAEHESSAMTIAELGRFDAKSYWERRLKWIVGDYSLHQDLIEFFQRAQSTRQRALKRHGDAFQQLEMELDLNLLADILVSVRRSVPVFVCFPLRIGDVRAKRRRAVDYFRPLPGDDIPAVDGKMIRLGKISAQVLIKRRRSIGRQLLRRNELAGVIEAPLGLGYSRSILFRIGAMTGKAPTPKNVGRYVEKYISSLMSEIDDLQPQLRPVVSIVEFEGGARE